jgi:hypothetical protein
MLATPARPFDSPEYSFEVKWDGVRALAAVEATGWRLVVRGYAHGCLVGLFSEVKAAPRLVDISLAGMNNRCPRHQLGRSLECAKGSP